MNRWRFDPNMPRDRWIAVGIFAAMILLAVMLRLMDAAE